jgi:competence protein ComEC
VTESLSRNWPALLLASACVGTGLSIWISVSLVAACVLAAGALGAVVVLVGPARLAALALAVAAVGLAWGSLRVEALRESVLAGRLGETGVAELVTVAPARSSPWSTRVVAVASEFHRERLSERVLLVLPVGRSPPRGAVLEATVRVTEPRAPEDGFDERAWLERQGIHVVLEASGWRQLGRRGGIAGLGDRLRDRVEFAVGRGTGGVRRAVVLGVVLGEDEGLPAAVQDDFRASGLYHLLAVSGQNVAFLAAGVVAIGWLLRLSRAAREVATVGVIGAYVLAVGWQPSVARAGVAGVLASLAWLTSRPRDRWHFLALGALILLAWMPTAALDPGFQLSFTAVAAIFVAVPRLRAYSDALPVPPGLADALAVSLACGVATAPIVLLQFEQVPLYTVLANVAAFPAAPLVLAFGLLAAVVDPVSPTAAAGLSSLAGLGAAWLELVARVVADLPYARIGAKPGAAIALGLVGCWLALRRARRLGRLDRRRVGELLLATGTLAVVGVVWVTTRPAPAWTRPAGLRVTFLDVGQGDSVLLETPRARILVDEGPPEANVAEQLRTLGVRWLSALVMTHPQRDHVGGAADVIRALDVGEVLEPGLAVTGPESDEALATARARRVRVRVVRAGTVLRAGRLRVRVLWPEDEGAPSEDPNQNAVVLLASYGETDVFLSGDAESDVTARLPLRGIDIMKVAHHGSEDSGLASELETLHPRIAVISCGRDNDYGHPRPKTLAALAAAPGLAVYRTDEDGRVVVESDGRDLRVRTQR